MDYKETLDYLYSQLPMFSRTGAAAMTKDLSNTIALCDLLGQPQQKFRSVHVGGTNGKGSTSHMLAAILQTAGYKTGLYTSPHLRDFRERIRINGEMISEGTVVDFVAKYKADLDRIQTSFFEMTVGLAFEVFAQEQVDIAIIEVGLGGRLDSTNVISPLLSVITNIGWDHMNLLGDTLPLIAAEKAGIIKKDTPVVIGEYQREVADVFINKAHQEQAKQTFASETWHAERNGRTDQGLLKINVSHIDQRVPRNLDLQLDLTGTYQIKNVKTVLSAVEELRLQGFNISDDHIRAALKQVSKLTGLNGRWQILGQDPLIICDTGHNPNGIAEVLKNIASTPHKNLHFVLGMVNDKDISKVLGMLTQDATYYFCRPNIPRGLSEDELREQANGMGLQGKAYPSVKSAMIAARYTANKDDLVFIGGSTFVVAEIV
ncbi:bifunctional folylpolyglutamate synthase/dihydrofolate synthase [Mucilaginibacter myungsuensis]|uniref:Dihydrofolate synthase/folylpolyglutamate synthase n=1 Tax=Mucilaginibacter myungsuensis TaxID=649104 RepID=A0A929PYR0_9SPHI|nr:folylpolyglutamate synthase/dihydrofolate synthase family protein [Mucilaginibacter myungsuensis]MBE9663592.1 bifunctional folylpolyglutamate synthase/dihydrofolate synthase [Mucilaginibacter myungsuensis]MDN3599084.1 folylpolyglutamate synthase/dihydrofolate synthase family protein [Mucilaginibacter myungsuensis]